MTETDAFAASLSAGPHALLGALVGGWAGLTRTWFRPGELADESETVGSFEAVLGGRFLVHEYRGAMMGEALEGRATLGFDMSQDRFVCAWVDSFHTGTGLMLSDGKRGVTDTISVLGTYDAGDGSGWGWRTTFAQPTADELVVAHCNLPPGVEEYLAVETRYRRVE